MKVVRVTTFHDVDNFVPLNWLPLKHILNRKKLHKLEAKIKSLKINRMDQKLTFSNIWNIVLQRKVQTNLPQISRQCPINKLAHKSHNLKRLCHS